MQTRPRYGPIDLIVLHDPEGANTAAELASYLRTIDAGYHSLDDDVQEIIMAGDNVVVQGAGGVNSRALHICFVPGRAAWTREQWLVHRAAIERGARRAAIWSRLHGIPLEWLTPGQVATPGFKGLCTHGDVSVHHAASEGHTDPGPNFPKDVFLAAARGQSIPQPPKELDVQWVAGPHKPVAGLPPGVGAGWSSADRDNVVLVGGQSIAGDRKGPDGTRIWPIPVTGGAHGTGIMPYGVTTLRPLGVGIVARDDKGGAHIGRWS